MSDTPDRHQIAVVTRSECHDTTWIGHVEDATFANTPAGPLRIVKEAVDVMVGGYKSIARWRKVDPDTWVYEVRP